MARQLPAMNKKQWRDMAVLAAIWAWSFVVYKMMGATYQPLMIAFLRCAIGGLYLIGYLLWWRGETIARLMRYRAYIPLLLVMSLVGNIIPFTLSGLLVKEVGSAVAAIINAMNPIFTFMLVRVFYDHHRLSWDRLLGIIIAILGISVMIGWDIIISSQRGDWHYLLREAGLMLVGFSFAIQSNLSRRRDLRRLPVDIMVAFQNILSAILLLPLVLLFDHPFAYPFPPSWDILAAAVFYNILSMGYAYIIYFNIIKRSGALNGSLVAMLMPPLGIVYSYLYFGEVLQWHQLLGFSIILLGLVAVDGRVLKKIRRPRRHIGLNKKRPRRAYDIG